MTADAARARDIFLDAVDRPPDRRAAFLAAACGSDAALRSEVNQLLAAHANPDSLLDLVAAPTDSLHGPGTPAGPRTAPASDLNDLFGAAAAAGDRRAADLLPLVYDELRKLAAARLAAEGPGHTLDATALVHEAYLRLIGPAGDRRWDGRGHFFAAAAEAMRRVLVNHARDGGRLKRGGGRARLDLLDRAGALAEDPDLVLSVDDLLTRLAAEDPAAARVAHLHLFGGLPVEQAGDALGQSRAAAYRNWKYARAWLRDALGK